MDLREHFDLAVGDDPGVAPGEMARAAIAEGTRRRRRRGQLVAAAGLVLVAGAVAALNLPLGGGAADPKVTIAAAMMPAAAPSCTPQPVESDATDVAVFFRGENRAALEDALRRDARVDTLIFESHTQAYEKFRTRWASNPDLLAAVTADRFPEAFRLRLAAPSQYTAFRARYATMAGVEQIVGRRCSPDAPVGGIQ